MSRTKRVYSGESRCGECDGYGWVPNPNPYAHNYTEQCDACKGNGTPAQPASPQGMGEEGERG